MKQLDIEIQNKLEQIKGDIKMVREKMAEDLVNELYARLGDKPAEEMKEGERERLNEKYKLLWELLHQTGRA